MRKACFNRWRTAAATPLLTLALALGLGVGWVPAAQAARLALVIGNDQYKVLSPLTNAAKDARDVAAELRAAGFDVPDKWVVQNGTRNSMRAALQDFVGRLRPEDEVVFYYSGHGVEIDAQAALVPVDLNDPARNPLDGSLRPLADVDLAKQQVLDESITLNRVAADIAGRGVKFSLLIVDACRDNPVVDLLKRAHASSPLKNAMAPPAAGLVADAMADSQVLLFSASKGQQSLDRLRRDDPVRNSVFTRVLLKAMRTPGLGLRDMLPQVKAEVRALAASVRINGRPHVQEPRSMAAYEAPNFHFRPEAVAPQASPAAEPPVRIASAEEVEQQLWNLIQDSRDIQDFRDYLQRYPNGRFASLAARQLRVLTPSSPTPLAASGRRAGDMASTLRDCDVCPELVMIPAGSFMMGSPPDEPGRESDEGPQRRVRIERRYAIGKTEVTQAQWRSVMGTNPSHAHGCDECPVERVSWDDVQQYIQKLNGHTGNHLGYRLPSEAEWEYAARAATTTAFWTGRRITQTQAHFFGSTRDAPDSGKPFADHSWHPTVVANYPPNGWGLHDMHGNVSEWVHDCYDDKAYAGKAPSNGRPHEWTGCELRVIRGGDRRDFSHALRSASRVSGRPDARALHTGFRLARNVP